MDRRQLGITLTAIALALVLGAGVALLATSGTDDEQVRSSSASTPTAPRASTTSTSSTSTTTRPPIVTVPTFSPGTVVVIPPTTTTTRQKRTPRTQPPATTAPPVTVGPAATNPPATTEPPTSTTAAPVTIVTEPSSTTTSTPTPGGASDVGITAKEIHLAVIADDVDVFDGARAWARVVNRDGGIAGRKLRLDRLSTDGTTAGYAAAVTTVCGRDFAVVAALSAFDADTAPLDCGIPDVAIETIAPEHASHPSTYAAFPRRIGTEAVGPYRYLKSGVEDCCSQYVLVPEHEPARAATEATIAAAREIGFETVATPEVADDASAADYQALAEDLVASDASFVASGLGRDSTVQLRRAASTAGVTGVDAWFCDARCYDPSFVADGAEAVEDQYVAIETVPLGDRQAVPALRVYVHASRRAGDEPSSTGLRAYATGLLAEDALRLVVDEHGADGITRARLLDALAGVDGFTADGITGPTDVGAKTPSGCTVLLQVRDGHFVRVHPAERGRLDCEAQNLVEVDD